MHFPVAGIDVNPFVPPLVAFGISLFTSMGGVSGAFLLLPFQMSVLGFTSPAVSSTNQLFNIVAIPSGVWRYIREGRMVWPLTWIVVLGTLPGVFLGALIRIRYLGDPEDFRFFAGLVLLGIGLRIAKDLMRSTSSGALRASEAESEGLVKTPRQGAGEADLPRVEVVELSWARVRYVFRGERYEVSVLKTSSISAAVGIVGGIYGIGGGAIIAPVLVAFFGLPVHTVAGASLMGTFVTSLAGVGFYEALAPFYPGLQVAPDWGLGLLFGLGGFAGMYGGARLQKHVPARLIKWMLAACVLFLAGQYILPRLGTPP